MAGLEGFKVKCGTCRAVLYETTEHYNCHKPLTGDMLRLIPSYKDWPCYDGSLACKATSRFLMLCSQCAGYISTTGKLQFADFPETKVTEISEERGKLKWGEVAISESKLIAPDVPASKKQAEVVAPEELIEKMGKKLPRKKNSKKRKRR